MPSRRAIKDEEYEIPYDDYEVMPINPLRRLEKRLEALEESRTLSNLERFIDKIIDMTELNQKIVEEVVRSNQGLREEIEVLVGKLDKLEEKIEQFVDILKMLGEEEARSGGEEVMMKIAEKFDDIANKIAESNTNVLQALTSIDKRLKKLASEGSHIHAMHKPSAPPASPAPHGMGSGMPPTPSEFGAPQPTSPGPTPPLKRI